MNFLMRLSPEKILTRNSVKSHDNNMGKHNENSHDATGSQDGGESSNIKSKISTEKNGDKSTKLKRSKTSKGKVNEDMVCERCVSEMECLVECEGCMKWLCVKCGGISNDVVKVLQNYPNAIHFHCQPCSFFLKNLLKNGLSNKLTEINDQQKRTHEMVDARIKTVWQKIMDMEMTMGEVMNKNVDIVKDNQKFAKQYSDAVKMNLKTKPTDENTPNTQTSHIQVVEALDELKDRERRQNNIVITGLKESVSDDPIKRQEEDISKVKEMIEEMKVQDASIIKAVRLGRRENATPDKPRLLLVMVDDIKQKKQLLVRAKGLRVIEKWKTIYISPDLTIKERHEGKLLRDKLKQLRNESKENYIIRRGKIVKANEGDRPTGSSTQEKVNATPPATSENVGSDNKASKTDQQ